MIGCLGTSIYPFDDISKSIIKFKNYTKSDINNNFLRLDLENTYLYKTNFNDTKYVINLYKAITLKENQLLFESSEAIASSFCKKNTLLQTVTHEFNQTHLILLMLQTFLDYISKNPSSSFHHVFFPEKIACLIFEGMDKKNLLKILSTIDNARNITTFS